MYNLKYKNLPEYPDSEKDNEKLFQDDEETHNKKITESADGYKDNWKILVVDDEEDIHSVTRLALTGFTYKDKGIEFLHTYSSKESESVISRNLDIAVILLDVVMETNTAGLDLVKFIREELNNRFTQIILRTGYPGYAPEREVIVSYDINDYKTKTELTSFKLFTLIMASLRAYDSITSLENLRQGLEIRVRERTIELEEKNLTMTKSIQYASRIQSAILPSDKLFTDFFSEYFILSKPKEIVSGDFCWVHKIGEKLIFTLADCTGHGVSGAFMSILGIMLLERITCEEKITNADDIVSILQERINIKIRWNKNIEELKDGLELTLCVFDPGKKTLQVSGNFNHIYLIRNHSLIIFKPTDNQNINDDILYDKCEINVYQGDVIYLFTDGFPDQFGGERRKRFTTSKIQDLLLEVYPKNMDEQRQILDESITKWKGSFEQIDDITVIGVRL